MTSVWGEKIRSLRNQLGWNQAELAEKAGGLNPLTISQIERGANTTTDTLQRIADALGVRLVDLFMDGKHLPDEEVARIIDTLVKHYQPDYERFIRDLLSRIFTRLSVNPKGPATRPRRRRASKLA